MMTEGGSPIISARKALFFALVLAAPLYILFLVRSHGILVPFWDQWEFVGLFLKAHEGGLAFSDIWAQHNEHRIFFPKLIMLALAWLTDWDIAYELYTNIVLAGITLLFLHLLIRVSCGGRSTLWFTAVVSLLVFSPAQYENWTWGWQIQMFLSVLATVVSVWSVLRWPGRLKGLAIAGAAAVTASFSFNLGLLTWFAAAVPLIMMRKWKRHHVALWAAAFGATAFLYYHDYTKPVAHPSVYLFVKHPYDYVRYVLAYLGAPLAYGGKNRSIALGILLAALMGYFTLSVARRGGEYLDRLLPWLSLATYAVLAAAATGIGRVGFGVAQALASRYATVATLFVVSALATMVLYFDTYRGTGKRPTIWPVAVAFSVSVLLVLALALSYIKGVRNMAVNTARIEGAIACLDNMDDAPDACLDPLYPDVAFIRKSVREAREAGIIKSLRGEGREKDVTGRKT